MATAVTSNSQSSEVSACAVALTEYCRKQNWAGYDPYDALNSRVFGLTPFAKSRICRIAITQIMKRLPVNIRPLLLVSREQNPKAIGLFLMALLKLSRLGLFDREDLIEVLVERLVALRSPNTAYWCWGYSFPWQTRTNMVPRWAPNLVCTVFVANALLDLYEERHELRFLSMAVSAADYIQNDLYWTEGDSVAGFSYPFPRVHARVHNANFLGASLLCRIYKHVGNQKLLDSALKVARYSAGSQHDDGSWAYGELPTQSWIDNFHTGYNLCALRSINYHASISEFETHLKRGMEFYRSHFFMKEGAPKYFHDRVYPVDIHSVAQSLITLATLKDLAEDNLRLAHSAFKWALAHMWDDEGKFFYYQVLPLGTNKISYMRWSQAWMLLALATLLEHWDPADIDTPRRECSESHQVA